MRPPGPACAIAGMVNVVAASNETSVVESSAKRRMAHRPVILRPGTNVDEMTGDGKRPAMTWCTSRTRLCRCGHFHKAEAVGLFCRLPGRLHVSHIIVE